MRYLHPLGLVMVVVMAAAGLMFDWAFQGQPFPSLPSVPWWVWGFFGAGVGLVLSYGLRLWNKHKG